MTIFIHIGMQKTGSSALETTFAANRERLESAGVDYPNLAALPHRFPAAHHDLAWAVQGKRRIADPISLIERVRARLAASRAGKIVLSSESFCDLKAAHVAALKALLPAGHDVRVVCYFRNQVDWVESFLNHKIKSSPLKSVRRIAPGWIGRTDYFEMIERWAAHFGEGAVVARIYRPGIDTVADFLGVIDVPDLALDRPPEPINVSLSAPLLRMKVVANLGGHNANIRRLLSEIQVATGMGPRTQLLTAEERREIIDIAAPSNQLLWDKYVRDQGPPFEFPEPTTAAMALTTKSLLEIVAHAVASQQRQIDELTLELQALKAERDQP